MSLQFPSHDRGAVYLINYLVTNMREIKKIFIHCSYTKADQDIGTDEIRQMHIARNWSDIGYHYVGRRSGVIETGRDLDGDGDIDEEIGAHVRGHNHDSLAYCLVGGKSDEGRPLFNFTGMQMKALRRWMDGMRARYPGVEFYGHRDFDSEKECPCFDVRAWYYG